MFHHIELGEANFTKSRKLKFLIDKGAIALAGNKQLKIYGTLTCRSGKRMKLENRVFFSTEKEAINLQFRPCGHCMKTAYKKWKDGLI